MVEGGVEVEVVLDMRTQCDLDSTEVATGLFIGL